MKRVPDVIFVVDGIYEKQAIKEANSLNIISYAIMNTNGDDDSVVNIIPANTNSVKSTEYIAEIIKKELAGVKVSAPNRANFKKMTPNKISGDRKQFTSKPNTSTETKKVEVKKVEIKKVVEKKEEIKKVEK
jgi:ribosomal protein S2